MKNKLGAVYTTQILGEYASNKTMSYIIHDLKEKCLSDDEIINKLISMNILDPACGDGALLISFECEIKNLLDRTNKNISLIDCKFGNTYGIDINEFAMTQAKSNLIDNKRTLNRESIFYCLDSIIPNFQYDGNLNDWKQYIGFNSDFTFDIIIANPPWGINLHSQSILDEFGYSLAKGQFDSYIIFIELCLRIASPDTYLTFIVPDSIFLNENKNLRKLMLTQCKILLISRLGEGFFVNVHRGTTILILKKETPNIDHKIECFRLPFYKRKDCIQGNIKISDLERENTEYIYQLDFMNNESYEFNIDVSNRNKIIIDKMRKNTSQIKDYLKSSRGIEISKKGNVVKCENCGKWHPLGNNTSILKCKFCKNSQNKYDNNCEEIITSSYHKHYNSYVTGEELSRYNIEYRNFINMEFDGLNYKIENHKNDAKILVRKTGIGINASIDYKKSYTPQTVFLLIKKELDNNLNIPIEAILGIINSRIILFYHLINCGEIEWKSFPYITQTILDELPIPTFTEYNQQTLEDLSDTVTNLLKTDKSIDVLNYEKLDMKIELLVMKLFKLTQEDFINAYAFIEGVQQLKSIKQYSFVNKIKFLIQCVEGKCV